MNALFREKTPILEIKNLSKIFGQTHDRKVTALHDVNLDIFRGECLGIVGESGCGKSTLARIITNIEKPTSGMVLFRGENISGLNEKALKACRRHIQMVFQNPADVFSPRMKIHTFLCEGLVNFNIMSKKKAKLEAIRLLEVVGLDASFLDRLPHQLSSGQLQRVVIARAISIKPDVILYDEATSALDVLIQKRILELLARLHKELGLTYIFIGHDLSVVRSLSHRIAVLFRGKVVEILESEHLIQQAVHPYTIDLLESVFSVSDSKNSKRIALFVDEFVQAGNHRKCIYADRCRKRMDICLRQQPELICLEKGHAVSCHLVHSPTYQANELFHEPKRIKVC